MKEELLGFTALIRAMNGEKNVIEHMVSEGQQEAIRRVHVAKKVRPSKEAWEQLGFTFTDIEGDDILCNATLPKGWSIQATEHSMWNNIIDENGMIRGRMYYKAAFYDRHAHMYLECRYKMCNIYVGEDHSTTEIYFGNNEEKLFVAGQIHSKENETREERLARYNLEEELEEKTRNWANQNYPDWENVHAYWDLPTKKDINTKTRHR